uniref:Uncharacterized protein n=1 Tax=Nymphaea colorata TaxID=210225 RepID=A0A5K1AAD3_9MAGN
MPKTGKVNKKN